jgi:hypothetical protein
LLVSFILDISRHTSMKWQSPRLSKLDYCCYWLFDFWQVTSPLWVSISRDANNVGRDLIDL